MDTIRERGECTHVGMRVGGFWCSEKRKTHHVSAGGEAVFGIVEDRDSIAVFG